MFGQRVLQLLIGAVTPMLAEGEPYIRTDLLTNGTPVALLRPGQLEAQMDAQFAGMPKYPFKNFPDSYVKHALATPVDWKQRGAVTGAKNQGGHGYCGTFGSVAAAEGQYAIRSGHGLRTFSEEQLVECIGWDRDQASYFSSHGFMDMHDYPPYVLSGPDRDPPIPGHPCRYSASRVIPGTASGRFTHKTGGYIQNEDQLVAFVHHNGPVQTGIKSEVFALVDKGCQNRKDCFVTADACNQVKDKSVDHSIALTGYGTDPKYGDYWIVKNSWGESFANDGFIKIARGVNCAFITCCVNLFTYGDPASYYFPSPEPSPPSPSPPAPPTPPSQHQCCWGSSNCATVTNCHHDAWCSASQAHCTGNCNGVWCPKTMSDNLIV